MRNIKFRAWVNGLGFVTPHLTLVNGKYMVDLRDYLLTTSLLEVDDTDVFLEQFTGLKDKDGVDIYDGDIAKRIVEKDNFNPGGGMGGPRYNQEATRRWKEEQIRAIIVAENGCPVFGHELISGRNSSGIEIIGNIHDNPDLVRVE